MTDLEKVIWAAAYAAEFASIRKLYESTPGSRLTIDDISGFQCAEVADVALEKFRDAVSGDDAVYLTICKEGAL